MARHKMPERTFVVSDEPSDVQVTIAVRPRAGRRGLPAQLAAAVATRPRTTLALVLAIVAAAAVVPAALHRNRSVVGTAHAKPAREAQLAGFGADFGYSLRCVSVTVSASNRAYVSVHVDHRAGCSRYDHEVRARGLLAPDESR